MLWTHLLMNGVQEVEGSNPFAPTDNHGLVPAVVFC